MTGPYHEAWYPLLIHGRVKWIAGFPGVQYSRKAQLEAALRMSDSLLRLWVSAGAISKRTPREGLTLLKVKLSVGSAFLLPRRRCWRSILVQETKAGLQVLTGSSRNEPCNT